MPTIYLSAGVTVKLNIGAAFLLLFSRKIPKILLFRVRTDSSGAFTSPYMKPGTYTMTRKQRFASSTAQLMSRTVYRMELAIASQSVSVSTNGLTTSNIASSEAVNCPLSGQRIVTLNQTLSEPIRYLANW